MKAWREIDSDRLQLGVRLWLTGGEVIVGRRMYRIRWWNR